MNHRRRNCMVACVIAATFALAAPALGRGGGGGGGGFGGGGGHGGAASAGAVGCTAASAACMPEAGSLACTVGPALVACTVEAALVACVPWAVLPASARVRALPGHISLVHVLPAHVLAEPGSRRAFHTRRSLITASSSITASVASRSLASRSALPITAIMTVAGRGFGPTLDRVGPTSACPTALTNRAATMVAAGSSANRRRPSRAFASAAADVRSKLS